MTCINSNRIPYLVAYDPNNAKLHIVESSAGISARNNPEFDYWYCQISCHNSFSCFNINDIMSPEVMQRIKNKELFLVVDNGLEPFLRSADGIYHNLVIKENIPAEQIIIMSSVPTMIDHVKQLARELQQPEIKVEWFSLFEWSLRDYVLHSNHLLPQTLERKNYNKKFINFNRRWRLHRPLLVMILRDRDLIKHGYVSLGESDLPGGNWERKINELQRYYKDAPQILEIIDRNHDIVDMPNLYLDTMDLVTNRAEQTDSTNLYYSDSYFSVITETTYHTDSGHDGVPFLSEKVFKAVAMKHPFILVTAPNTLQYLKKLGYKTFSSIIDESYDTELNDAARIIKIADEIQRLCNLSETELDSFLESARQICSYNHKILKYQRNTIHRMN
jgi:hypothetical protein